MSGMYELSAHHRTFTFRCFCVGYDIYYLKKEKVFPLQYAISQIASTGATCLITALQNLLQCSVLF